MISRQHEAQDEREQSDRQATANARDVTAHRVRAAQDRAMATAECEANEIDAVTGARRRGPGLVDIRREIDRARRGDGRLVAAYVDVDGLKAINDSQGHHAGDVMLRRIVSVLQTHLRAYESVIRLGGDEFVSTLSGTTIERARERFDEIAAQLDVTPGHGSISVGFAQLDSDSPMDLIDRADNELLAARGKDRNRRSRD